MHPRTTLMVITPTLQCGGAEKYTAALCNNIDKEKFRVVLVVVNNADPFFRISPGVELVDLRKKRVASIFFSFRKLIREVKPDVIFSTANHLTLYNAILKKFYNYNCKWIARETSIASVNTRYAKSPVIYRKLLKIFCGKNDLVVCQNAEMKQDLVRNFNVPEFKCIIIPSGIETGTGDEPAAVDLLSVGRLSSEKGFDRVLEALSKVNRPYTCVIAGDGNLKEQLSKKAHRILNEERKIHFAGAIENPVSKYAKARLFISGSHYEGSPNAVLEANAMGIPVVAFDVPGIREVVKNGYNGFLVKDGEIGEFAKKIEEALVFPFKRDEIAEYTRRQFGLKKMINSTEAAILQLLNRNDD